MVLSKVHFVPLDTNAGGSGGGGGGSTLVQACVRGGGGTPPPPRDSAPWGGGGEAGCPKQDGPGPRLPEPAHVHKTHQTLPAGSASAGVHAPFHAPDGPGLQCPPPPPPAPTRISPHPHPHPIRRLEDGPRTPFRPKSIFMIDSNQLQIANVAPHCARDTVTLDEILQFVVTSCLKHNIRPRCGTGVWVFCGVAGRALHRGFVCPDWRAPRAPGGGLWSECDVVVPCPIRKRQLPESSPPPPFAQCVCTACFTEVQPGMA